jgi:Coenzyme PQQ synthesis protein D (PqqD)
LPWQTRQHNHVNPNHLEPKILHKKFAGPSVTIFTMNYRHNPSVVVTDLEDELVLLDPISKQMFSLNAVGRVLWFELPALGLQGALERVTRLFDVTFDQARTDALLVIDHLVKSNLLEVLNPVTDSGTDSGTLEVT